MPPSMSLLKQVLITNFERRHTLALEELKHFDCNDAEGYQQDFPSCTVEVEDSECSSTASGVSGVKNDPCTHVDLSGLVGSVGFDLNLLVEEILDIVTDKHGRLVFLIKFRGLNDPELIPACVVHKKVPELAMQFYLKRRLGNNFGTTLFRETF